MAVVIAGTASELRAEARVALVIGNGDYAHSDALKNPPNDASDVADSLKRLGFAVTKVVNGTYGELRQAIRSFNVQVQGADIGLIYYAGHGMELAGENWLIPVDADLKTDLDLANEAVSLKTLMQSVSRAGGLGIVILDACRDNPFAVKMARSKLTRSVDRGFARVEPTTNVLVAYAAKDGTTAKDGDRRNSPYTAALLKNLETPGLEISYMFRNVRDEVMKSTNRRQQPFVYGSLSSKAVYLKDAAPRLAATPKPIPAPSSVPQAVAKPADETVWAAIRDSSDPQLLQNFLSTFPGSSHESQARTRLAELQVASECDRIAGSGFDRNRNRTIAVGQRDDSLSGAPPNPCEQAMRKFPDNARFALQAGWIAEARKDYSGARALYEKAGAIGSAPAMLRLGTLYETGQDGAQDLSKAHEFYSKAAAAGNPRAMTNLGRLYEAGHGVKRDYNQARLWYEKAANLGDRPAMASIGKMYERGLGVQKNQASARAWYRKAASASEREKPVARGR